MMIDCSRQHITKATELGGNLRTDIVTPWAPYGAKNEKKHNSRNENAVLAEPALRLVINYRVILTGSNNVGVGGASVSYFPASTPQIAQTVDQTKIDQDQEASATWVSRMNAFSRELLCVESYMVPDVWDEGWNDYHYGSAYAEPRYILDYDSK